MRNNRYKYIRNLAPERPYTCHITNSNNFKENGGAGMYNSWLKRVNRDPEARRRVKEYQHRPPEELYDLQKDPHELRNLANDLDYRTVKNDLKKELFQWMKQQGDPGLGRMDALNDKG